MISTIGTATTNCFQQLLQHQLELKLDTEEIGALHNRTSTRYAENGFIDEALHHALKAGDLSVAAQLVERNGPVLLNEDKWYTLEKWLAHLPDDIIQQRPKLMLAQARMFFIVLRWGLFRRFLKPLRQFWIKGWPHSHYGEKLIF